MGQKFVLVFYILSVIGVPCIAESAKTSSVNGNCGTVCSCKETSQLIGDTEFNAICEGNGTQEVVLDESLFATEPIPDWTRRVYVRVKNFTSVRINESFLARWLAYTSCSFDIWSCGNVSFPKQAPPLAESDAIDFVFAGIGMVQCSIDQFSTGLLDGKATVGLNIVNSLINHLNLFDLNPKSINYLKIKNSIVKTFDGRPGKAIIPESSLSNGSPKINIQDSQIGFMGENALSLSNYNEDGKVAVNVKTSTIGILQKSALKMGKGIQMNIVGNVLGFVAPSILSLHPGSNVSLTKNILGLEKDSMRNLKCSSSLQIAKNIILPRHQTDCVFPITGEEPLVSSCDNKVKVDEYLDSSCTDNWIVSSETIVDPLLPKLTSPAPQNSSSNDHFNESTPVTYVSSASRSNNQVSIPTGLFYLVLGLCFFLIIVVVSLIGLSIWGKMSKERKVSTSSRCHIESSSIYETPNAYFAPVPTPQKMTYEKDIESDRYQFGTLGSKRIECVDEDDSVYLNMK